MRKLFLLLILGLAAQPTLAAGVQINQLPSGSVSGAYVTVCDNLTTTYACTFNQLAAYFQANLNFGNLSASGTPVNGNLAQFASGSTITNGNLSGDCTTSGSLAITCLKTNGTNFGTFAIANAATPPAIGGTTPAAGAFTTLSASSTVSGTGFSTYLASPPAIGGTTAAAGTFNALTDLGITGLIQCVHVNTAGLFSGTGADCGAGGGGGSGTVNSAAAGDIAYYASTGTAVSGAPLAGNLALVSGAVTTSQPINAQTGTSYTIVATDAGRLITTNNSSSVAVTLPQAGTTGFTAGFSFDVENIGAGTVTITPAVGLINGAATLTVQQNKGCTISSDGTNYQVSACPAVFPGATASFGTLTSGTNGSMAGILGTGSSLTVSGTGTNNANRFNGAAAPASAAVLASNSSSQFTALTLGNNLAVASSVLGTTQPINAQTGTTYAIASSDAGKLLTFSNASAVAVSLSAATTTGFTAGFSFDVENIGVGTVTITPATSTVNGAATLVIATNQGCTVSSDGTNYQISACTALGGFAATIPTQTVLGNGSGSVGAPVALALSGNLVATNTGLATSQAINPQTGTSYAIATTDSGKLLTFSNSSAVAVSLAQATATGYTAGFSFDVQNLGVGLVTITPATSTINGAATLSVPKNTGCTVTSDGTNYQISACNAASSSISGTSPSISSGFGTGASVTHVQPTGKGYSLSINVGTGGSASSGVISLPNQSNGVVAPGGWACSAADVTTPASNFTQQSASSTTSASVTNYVRTTGVAGAWTASDVLQIICEPN